MFIRVKEKPNGKRSIQIVETVRTADYTSISSKVTESSDAASQNTVITNLSTRNIIVGGGVTLKW